MNQYEKRERAIEVSLKEHADDYKAVLDKAEAENRQPTEEDRTEITEHMTAIEALKKELAEVKANMKTLKEVDDISRSLGPQVSNFGRDVEVTQPTAKQIKSLGDQFIESKGYKGMIERGLTGEFTSGQVELDEKATLAETVGTSLTPAEYRSGVVETLYQRLYVADLLGQATTTASQVRYVTESTATNAAAAVAQAQAKPESTLAFSEVHEPVRKVATILPVTDEMLEDAPQISAYINQRLTLFVKQTEEAQLLTGVGTGANLAGLITTARPAIGTFTRSAGTSNEVALFRAANGARGSSFLDPDAIVMHPSNWAAIRLGTDTAGQYFGGGPFYGPYGGPQGPSSSSQFSADNLWGLRVVVTNAIPLGTALVGAFQTGAQLFRRSGVMVEATNSHSTWFADNITALRAEERLALAVYRPSSFVAVIGLSAA